MITFATVQDAMLYACRLRDQADSDQKLAVQLLLRAAKSITDACAIDEAVKPHATTH